MTLHVSPAAIAAGHQFTKAQIAEIARGARIAVRLAKPKPDPVIAMVEKADAALERYVVAVNNLNAATEKLKPHDRGWVCAYPIDDMIPEWSHSDGFPSEGSIDKAFADKRKLTVQRLRGRRARLKTIGSEQIRFEMQQAIERDKKLLANLPKWREPMKKAFRAEARRLAKAQRAVGLQDKRIARSRAWLALWEITAKLRKATPRTVEGALALLAYVESRSRDDLVETFTENGTVPAALCALIGRSRSFLARGPLAS